MTDAQDSGRVAQRRRTRKGIVEAATGLLLRDEELTVGSVAAAADVSVRTVYSYFPSLDALALEAALTGLSSDISSAAHSVTDDVHANIQSVIDGIFASVDRHLPLGRKLIKLTIDAAPEPGAPRRGYRRIEWLESALGPVRGELEGRRFDDLVSALAVVIGWESFIVLTDIRGLDRAAAHRVTSEAAHMLIDAALHERGE